jgi:hypothetical protein
MHRDADATRPRNGAYRNHQLIDMWRSTNIGNAFFVSSSSPFEHDHFLQIVATMASYQSESMELITHLSRGPEKLNHSNLGAVCRTVETQSRQDLYEIIDSEVLRF